MLVNKIRFRVSAKTTGNLLLMVTITALVNACAGRVTRAISADDRDTSGTFDGRWIGTVVHTQSTQRFQGWVMSCAKPMNKIAILVKNGQVSTEAGDDAQVAYISREGRFRIAIPSGRRASASIASEVPLNSQVTYFVDGDLGTDKTVGAFVIGIADFGNSGCTSSISYSKI